MFCSDQTRSRSKLWHRGSRTQRFGSLTWDSKQRSCTRVRQRSRPQNDVAMASGGTSLPAHRRSSCWGESQGCQSFTPSFTQMYTIPKEKKGKLSHLMPWYRSILLAQGLGGCWARTRAKIQR
jgi:hypothetical protein